ncbi:hypothetical protein HQ590_16320, partial [bacterium]|nr:hypothetical protein [bacterium]
MPKPEPAIDVLHADRETGAPVVIGVPFPRGALKQAAALSVLAPNGVPCPAAVRPLVTWPDGSVRWALVTMLAREPGRHRLKIGRKPTGPAKAEHAVQLRQDSGTATLDNGLVKIVLASHGRGPLQEITAGGRAWLSRAEDLRLVVNDADTTRETERQVQVLEQSPLRTRVRVSGCHVDADGRELLQYRLDVELWAGWPVLRLDYQFINLERGRDEVGIDRLGLEWDLPLGTDARRHFVQSIHGLSYLPRDVFNPAPVAICADDVCGPAHVADPAMLLDSVQYPSHLRPPLIGAGEWLGVGDGSGSVYLRMQDFIEMRPKRLSSAGRQVALEIWPAAQGRLALPQGRSRRQVLSVALSDQSALSAGNAERLLAAPWHEGRAVVAPAWLRRTGEFEVDRLLTPGTNIRFEKYLRWLVDLSTPQDMFDLGDTIDSGYCRTYVPVPNNVPLKPGAPALPRVFLARGHSPLAEWSVPQFYEPVWTNNEYDALFALCTELMRSGRGDLWHLARWSARHNIEVDFVHYHDDPQQHRGVPQHSVNHNRSGSIPSHYWTQGLLQYYCLTGDRDVLEIARAVGDKIIEDFAVPAFRELFWSFTRELGWPTLALAHLVDITGDPRYAKQLDEIVAYLMQVKR